MSERTEHRVRMDGGIGIGWLALVAVYGIWSFDMEIRCVLGNEAACITASGVTAAQLQKRMAEQDQP